MRKNLIQFLLAAFLMICCGVTISYAQTTVKGKVVDAETEEPMIGASVMVAGTTQGTVTDIDGYFTLKTSSSNVTLEFKYLGYKDLKKKISKSGKVDLGTVSMHADAVALSDVTITSSVAIQRKTPVAVSTLDPVFIEEKLSTQEFPEILKSTPGVYATKESGGYGDSRVDLRGFSKENIAVMVNGVPMNDMEWGGLYWSNWTGLSDVTRSMQVQRGLGASKICAPAVGGSINIITKTTDAQKGGSIYYGLGNDGFNKIAFNASTGMNDNGWSFSVMGSKTWGDGYIQGTSFDAYAWFVNISKAIGDNQSLSLTATGSPQSHYKRFDKLTVVEWEKQPLGTKYNAAFGYDMNGNSMNGTSYNYYHKPQISLNHNWDIDGKSSLSTSLYMSIGRGYGYRGVGEKYSAFYGATNGVPNTTYRKIDGTFDFGKLMEENAEAPNGSLAALSKSINNHMWYGLLSTYTRQFTDKISFQGGLDLRYYEGLHKNEISDLMGGQYVLDPDRNKDTHWQYGNEAYKNQKLKKGDIVYRDYTGYVAQYGFFAQSEYSTDKLSAFVAVNGNLNSNWRMERFYRDHEKSNTKNKLGLGIKGGVNYNFDEHHNVFANIGYFSRTPYFGTIFLAKEASNAINPNAANEKVFSYEIGYGFKSSMFTAHINAYRTLWMDRTISKSMSDTPESSYFIITGLDELHQGIELDFVFQPIRQLTINGMFSIGDWKYNNSGLAYRFDKSGQPLDAKGNIVAMGSEEHDKTMMNLKNIKMGNSAQTTAALGVSYEFMKGLRFGIDGNFYGRNYSQFDVTNVISSGVNDFFQPWRIPSAYVFDARMSYRFKIGGLDATLIGNVNNLFNEKYITDAQDNGVKNKNSNHGWEDATVFYGFGRTWSASLKVRF